MASTAHAAPQYRILRRRDFMQINDKAPDFSLQDEDGKPVSLADFRGQNVVLYFFPKADTPG
jgi:peroxiredoxin